MKKIIYAANIHTGGGAVLLNCILDNINVVQGDYLLFLDSRFSYPANKNIFFSNKGFLKRLLTEYRLYKLLDKDDILFCLGNLPPLFRMKSKVLVIFQNRLLVDGANYKLLTISQIIRLVLQKSWLKLFLSNADRYIVQTRTMSLLFSSKFGNSIPLSIIPFVPHIKVSEESTQEFDLIYPASGNNHKNHKNLIKALILLANDGIFPSLAITLDSEIYINLLIYINHNISKHKLNITNISIVEHSLLCKYLCNSKALIFPSFVESFGLPLVEAKMLNKTILAPELDYVRDVCVPDQTFDPNSPRSIASAIKRYLYDCDDIIENQSVSTFINTLVKL